MIRVLIADDHEGLRKGLRQMVLDGFPDVHIEEAWDCPSLIEKAHSARWDIIVSDLAMPGGGGLEALRIIRIKYPDLPVLIVSIHEYDKYGAHAVRAGANGYVSKDSIAEKLIPAMKTLLSGDNYPPTA
jgi:two-component system invasion response regulator UvrY